VSLWKRLTSIRTSAVLLSVLALFLLLNVVVPQEAVVGEVGVDRMVEGRPVARFLMVTLGFGRIPVSPLFLGLLTLFLVNLTAVLLSRIRPTLTHIRLEPPAEQGLRARAEMSRALVAARPEAWSRGDATRALRGHGFRVSRVGESVLWAVKHRTAPLGFLLFHFSFFLLFLGGGLIYYTRFVGLTTLIERQEFDGRYQQVLRRPPTGRVPPLRFFLEEVEARYEDGFPVHLGATLRLRRGGSAVEKRARVNHPATWGAATLLVRQAGLAPGFWLQDERGYSLDRVAVAAKTLGDESTTVPLDAASLMLTIEPLPPGVDFPEREGLAGTALTVSVMREDEVLFEGELRPGEAASWDEGRLVLEEIRYWAGIQVVEERGGGILILGFLVGVAGLVWRLVWYRREVAVVWDESEVRLVGKGEYYRGHFRHELEEILTDVLGGSAEEASSGSETDMQLESEDEA
jgi:hypothetical protein